MGSPPNGRRRRDECGVTVYGMLLDGNSRHENEKSNQLQGTGAIGINEEVDANMSRTERFRPRT